MVLDTFEILIAMIIYMAIVIIIGLVFAKRANANSENYFLGGRTLGPWVSAMSAEARDSAIAAVYGRRLTPRLRGTVTTSLESSFDKSNLARRERPQGVSRGTTPHKE